MGSYPSLYGINTQSWEGYSLAGVPMLGRWETEVSGSQFPQHTESECQQEKISARREEPGLRQRDGTMAMPSESWGPMGWKRTSTCPGFLVQSASSLFCLLCNLKMGVWGVQQTHFCVYTRKHGKPGLRQVFAHSCSQQDCPQQLNCGSCPSDHPWMDR